MTSNVKASMDFSGPLNALSVSPNKTLIAVGGRDVLKVIAIENSGFVEKRNLRVGKANLNFSTNDVRWHPLHESEHLLATAATNGAVIIWNFLREGFKQAQERILNDHNRAVNRICWHPSDGNVLLTGSQDATIKLWDKRGKCTLTYKPKSESVRDIQFNPFQTSKFAAAFENGTIQVWDLRKTSTPEYKFTAHSGLVLALDWHPKQPFTLATGSRDRTVKIWDLMDCKQPQLTIQTIASVCRVQWRPTFQNHIATCASLMDHSIHLWDITHPNSPIASMGGHSDVVTGIQWLETPVSNENSDLSETYKEGNESDIYQHLISCSRDCTLKFHSLSDAYMPNKHMCTLALALNPSGKIASTFTPIDRSNKELNLVKHFSLNNSLYTVTDIGQPLVRSTSSDSQISINQSVDHQQVGATTLPLISKQGSPIRYENHHLHLIPSVIVSREAILSIYSRREKDEYKEKKVIQRTEEDENAAAIFGFDRELFCYFAYNYHMFGKPFKEMCDHNAEVCQKANQIELCQVWRIVKLFYESSPEEGSDSSNKSSLHRAKFHTIEEPSAPKNQITLLLQELDQANPQAMQDFEPSPYEVDSSTKPLSSNISSDTINVSTKNCNTTTATTTSSSSASLVSNPSLISPIASIREATVKELLEYYCDLGDVQTCVTIACVLNTVNGIENVINGSWLQELYVYYIGIRIDMLLEDILKLLLYAVVVFIFALSLLYSFVLLVLYFVLFVFLIVLLDLLHLFQLYSVANELISQCSDRGIRQMNMKSTTIYSNCSNCNKDLDLLERHRGRCVSCHHLPATCSLCQQPVKGIFVWCPVCCHGGHLEHMNKWFSSKDVCPTGCLHKCSPFLG